MEGKMSRDDRAGCGKTLVVLIALAMAIGSLYISGTNGITDPAALDVSGVLAVVAVGICVVVARGQKR